MSFFIYTSPAVRLVLSFWVFLFLYPQEVYIVFGNSCRLFDFFSFSVSLLWMESFVRALLVHRLWKPLFPFTCHPLILVWSTLGFSLPLVVDSIGFGSEKFSLLSFLYWTFLRPRGCWPRFFPRFFHLLEEVGNKVPRHALRKPRRDPDYGAILLRYGAVLSCWVSSFDISNALPRVLGNKGRLLAMSLGFVFRLLPWILSLLPGLFWCVASASLHDFRLLKVGLLFGINYWFLFATAHLVLARRVSPFVVALISIGWQ
jgi:hypothetical protein